MWLIAGLGNPGPAYAGNRHNIGFMAADRLAEMSAAGAWRAKWKGLATEARIGSDKAWLLKPQTYMNESGESVGAAMRFLKLEPAQVCVLYDELDLAPGRVKAKLGGGAAGHNGVRSIAAHIGPEFWRVRLGIGHPGHKDRVLGHVLSDFAKTDRDWLADTLDAVAQALPFLLGGDAPRFMSDIALRTGAPDPAAS